jgi:hypothetical protein
MKPPLHQLSYFALDEISLPLLDSNQAARDQSPVPYQLGEGVIVPRAGFEPAFPDLKDRPFRRTWQYWSGQRELNSRPLLGKRRLYRLSYARVADGASA